MVDLHNVCLVIAILSLSVSCVVIWSSFVRQSQEYHQLDSKEMKMAAMLKELEYSQLTNSDTTTDATDLVVQQLLMSHFPSLKKTSRLGNYFSRGYFIDRGKYHQEYTHSSLVLLPFFQDFDGDFDKCLHETAVLHNQAVSPKMTFWNRQQWDKSNHGVFRYKHKYRIHFGEAAFGICDEANGNFGDIFVNSKSPSAAQDDAEVKRNAAEHKSGHKGGNRKLRCGHALIMQDPITKAIADYGSCLLNPQGKPHCQFPQDQNFTIEDWIIKRGNVVLQSLLFNPKICKMGHPSLSHLEHKPSDHLGGSRSSAEDPTYSLCQKHHEDILESLEPEIVRRLLDFITGNLERLFSVVGLYEDLENSLSLFHQVFRLPLHECEFVSKFSSRGSKPSRSSNSKVKYRYTKTREKKLDTNPDRHLSKLVYLSEEKLDAHEAPSLSTLVKSSQDDVSLISALSQLENSFVRETNMDTKLSPSLRAKEKSDDTVSWNRGHEMTSDDNLGVKHSDYNDDENDDVTLEFNAGDKNNTSPQTFSDLVEDDDNDNNTIGNDDFYEDDDDNYDYRDDRDAEESEKKYRDEVISEHMVALKDRLLKTNTAYDRLYNRLSNSEKVQAALSLDINLYKAVKKLYYLQKQLFFNSM